MKESYRNSLAVIILIYFAANFFMFFNAGWFWDDWCLSSKEGITSLYHGTGYTFMAPIISFIMNLSSSPALIFHIFTGLLEIAGIFLFYKSMELFGFRRSDNFLLTAIFATLTYNFAKITIICFIYSVGLFFFLLATYLLIKYLFNRNLIFRIFSLIFYFISFILLPSTLILSIALLLFLAIYSESQKIELKLSYFRLIVIRLFKLLDFILLPFIFWIFKELVLTPEGIYANQEYRELYLRSVVLTPYFLISTFIQNLIGLGNITQSSNYSQFYSFLLILVFSVIFLVIRKHKYESGNNNNYLLLGVYFFTAGALTYVLVGLYPSFEGFNSRHQILLRFGAVFVIYFFMKSIDHQIKRMVFISLIFSLFIVNTISYQLQFQKSWFKQLALENVFLAEKRFSDGINIVIVDKTLEYNEFSKSYDFYVYTGIFNKIYGTQTRFAIDSDAIAKLGNYDTKDFINSPEYHMKDCKSISTFNYICLIEKGNFKMTEIENLRLLYLFYIDRSEFNRAISNLLKLTFFEIKPNNL